MRARMRWAGLGLMIVPGAAYAQVADLINSLEVGGRALGMGSSSSAVDVSPQSAFRNPAGLGYLKQPTASLTFRNLPESQNIQDGTFLNPNRQTSRRYGRTGLSSLAYAVPAGRGTIGLSFHRAGWAQDDTFAFPLTNGNQTIVGYESFFKSQTDLFSISYGQESGTSAWGLGLVWANQYLKVKESYTIFTGNIQTGTVNQNAAGNAQGVGAQLGYQTQAGPKSMIGMSVRSPISLNGSSEVRSTYSRIPGLAQIGFTTRVDYGNREDYLVYSAQAAYSFGGSRNDPLERKNTLSYGVGVEYSLVRGGTRYPIRLGYSGNPSQGEGFDSYDSFTFGLGWRPGGGRIGVDLGFGKRLQGGPLDASIGLTYAFGK